MVKPTGECLALSTRARGILNGKSTIQRGQPIPGDAMFGEIAHHRNYRRTAWAYAVFWLFEDGLFRGVAVDDGDLLRFPCRASVLRVLIDGRERQSDACIVLHRGRAGGGVDIVARVEDAPSQPRAEQRW